MTRFSEFDKGWMIIQFVGTGKNRTPVTLVLVSMTTDKWDLTNKQTNKSIKLKIKPTILMLI